MTKNQHTIRHRIERLALPSLANWRGHWSKRARIVKSQRDVVFASLNGVVDPLPDGARATVQLCRVAPRQLDSDNLRSALKASRDAVADRLLPVNRGNQSMRWADDSDGRITWVSTQRRGDPGEQSLEIQVEIVASDD